MVDGKVDNSADSIRETVLKLLAYCQANDWAGYDPYDATNSEFFRILPLLDRRLPRLVLTQLLKRSPINFRRLLMVPKTQNPKGLALFLMAFLKLRKLGLLESDDLIQLMIQKLIGLRSPVSLINPLSREPCAVSRAPFVNPINPYFCWGYSFPWQTRTIVVPRFAPNLVCTTFVANALLDAYEVSGETSCLDMATSAAEYILNELYWTEGESTACYSYPIPTSRGRVHNANFLGAALLCRVFRHCGREEFLDSALKVARYSASQQQDDGSWYYGEHSTQRWIDNFHTGYNLCGLKSIGRYADTLEFESNIQRGFEFYRNHFFREDGAPKYFHDRTYPIDIHSVAQSIITLTAFKEFDENSAGLAQTVFRWTMANMWDEKGYFYYRVLSLLKVRISYMRWTQAWMLLALSTLLMMDGEAGTTKYAEGAKS
jgi:hypothetical protein